MKTAYLLTGKPGVGKTTLIKEVVKALGSKAGGFYTQEIRVNGIRRGFKIVTLDGKEATLAHVTIRTGNRVSKYGVDTEGLDDIGIAALQKALLYKDLVVIDEIGKMELFSPKFKETVLKIIRSNKKVLGTVTLQPSAWTDALKQKPQVNVVNLTRANYQEVLKDVIEWVKTPKDRGE